MGQLSIRVRKGIKLSGYILYYVAFAVIYSLGLPFDLINYVFTLFEWVETEWLQNLILIPTILVFFFCFLASFILPILARDWIDERLDLQQPISLKDQTEKLVQTKEQLESIIDISENLRTEIETKWKENEELRRENEILLSTRNDSTTELMMKLKAIEAVSKKKRKRELIVAFTLGLVSSLMAAYLFDLFRLIPFAKN